MRAAAAALLALAAAVPAVLASAPPAAAIFDTCTQSSASALPFVSPWTGSATASGDLADHLGEPGVGATAYEWWGSGGLKLTTNNQFNDDTASAMTWRTCEDGNVMLRNMNNLWSAPFDQLVTANDNALSLTMAAQTLSVLPMFADNVIVPITEGADPSDPDSVGLGDVYRDGLLVVFAFVGGWAAWKLVRGRQKEAGIGIAWNLAAAAVGMLLVVSPTLLPDTTSYLLGKGQSAVASVAQAVTSGVQPDSQVKELCTLADDIPEEVTVVVSRPGPAGPTDENVRLPSTSTREALCTMWASTVYASWERAQFGAGAIPTTETYRDDDGNVDKGVWDAATMDPTIATVIPGLETQPPAGSLPALQLNALTLNAAEQRWLDQQPDRQGALRQLTGPQPGASASSGPPYPASAIAGASGVPAEAFAAGVNTMAHQRRWDVLRDSVNNSQQQGLVYAWSGGDGYSGVSRTAGLVDLVVSNATMLLPGMVFTVALMWFQVALGLMFAFLGFVLLLAALPQWGAQFVRDYLNKVLKYILMLLVTLLFSTLAPTAAFALPAVLFPDSVPTANPAQGIMFYLASAAFSVALVVAWWKLSRGIKRKTLVSGANENSRMDLAGRTVATAEVAGRNAAIAGAAVGAAAATGGTSAALMAAGGVAGGAATGGKGNMEAKSRESLVKSRNTARETVTGKPSGGPRHEPRPRRDQAPAGPVAAQPAPDTTPAPAETSVPEPVPSAGPETAPSPGTQEPAGLIVAAPRRPSLRDPSAAGGHFDGQARTPAAAPPAETAPPAQAPARHGAPATQAPAAAGTVPPRLMVPEETARPAVLPRPADRLAKAPAAAPGARTTPVPADATGHVEPKAPAAANATAGRAPRRTPGAAGPRQAPEKETQ